MLGKINRQLIWSFLVSSVLYLPSVAVVAQQSFPEGQGRQAIFVACTQCHGLDRLTRVSLTRDEWENALYDMMARGAVVDVKDLDNVRDYLMDNFAVNN